MKFSNLHISLEPAKSNIQHFMMKRRYREEMKETRKTRRKTVLRRRKKARLEVEVVRSKE